MEESDNNQFIDPKDFESMEIRVIKLMNESTHTAIEDGARVYGNARYQGREDEDLSIQFVELLEYGLVVELPPHSCAQGHTLSLELETRNARPADLELYVGGKVVEAEALENQKQRVKIQLTRYESKQWEAFQKIFSSRQNEIEEFFASVKGF